VELGDTAEFVKSMASIDPDQPLQEFVGKLLGAPGLEGYGLQPVR